MMKILSRFKLSALTLSLLSLSLLTTSSYGADCSSVPIDPAGDVSKLKDALQQATNTGQPLTITGTYQISEDLRVYLKKDLIVDATAAKFIATENLDGDMFSLDSHGSYSNQCGSTDVIADVHWNGGDFNMALAKVSKVVPITSRTPAGREGTKQTADALSIRGVIKGSTYRLKVNEVFIENITVTGTLNDTDNLFLAGGDSGILMVGAAKATIKNNKFYGIRDAAVYLSAGGPTPDDGGTDGTWGSDFLIENNYAERTYDAFTSKRGADNVTMINNEIKDAVVGLSIKQVYDGWHADTVTISNNIINKSVRPISIEKATDVTIENNTISGLGDPVADQDTPINAMNSGQYEGIGLYGVNGTNFVKNNIISGRGEKNTVGITTINQPSKYAGPSLGFSIADNTMQQLKTNLKLDGGTISADPSLIPTLSFTQKPTTVSADYETIIIKVDADSPSDYRQITQVALYLDNKLLSTNKQGPFYWDHNSTPKLLNLAAGQHQIKVVVTDSRGDSNEAVTTFTVLEPVIDPTPTPGPSPEPETNPEPKPEPTSGGSGGAIAWLLISLFGCRLIKFID